jgi:hypothetical protein
LTHHILVTSLSSIIHLYSSIYQFQKSTFVLLTINSTSKSFSIDLVNIISQSKLALSSPHIIKILSNSSLSLSFLLIYIHINVSSKIGFHTLKIFHSHTGLDKSSKKYHSIFQSSLRLEASKSTNFHQLSNFFSVCVTTYEIFIFGILSTFFSITSHLRSTSSIIKEIS